MPRTSKILGLVILVSSILYPFFNRLSGVSFPEPPRPTMATSLAFSNPQMVLSTSKLHQLYCPFLPHVRNHSISDTCSIKLPRMRHLYKPSMFNSRISCSKEKLWASIPDTVKGFPWEKAENVAVQQLLVLGKEALKWSLIGLFFLSSVSDIAYSISRNKELVIPFGLFAGCMMTDFLKETSRELLLNFKEGDVTWQILGISCFFVLLKTISVCFPVGLRVFLLHAANGGILQLIWHYRNLQDKDNTVNSAVETNITRAVEDQPLHQS